MSFINKRRQSKNPAPRLRGDDDDFEPEEAAPPWEEDEPKVNTRSKGSFFAKKREPKTTALSDQAKSCGKGVMRGDYRGEIKEGMGTIKRGEQGERKEGRSELPQVLASLVQKAQTAFKRRQTIAARKPKRAPKMDRLWFEHVVKNFPRAAPPLWDAQHRALAKNLASRVGNEEAWPLVKWSIENWTAIMQTRFSWMTKQPAPKTPTLPFLVKFVHVFKEEREKAQDAPLQVEALVKGLNLAKKTAERRSANTPPVSAPKPILPKKDLSATMNPLPALPDWRD